MSADRADEPLAGTQATVFSADAELRPDLERVDWAATPLGSPDTWPQSLQTAVNTVLSSRFSMWMAWGPDLTFFCNAAYRHATLGTGELVYSGAGHPPPVLVQSDGSVRMLDDARSIPLGLRLRSDLPRPEARITLPARATLLLYTDGLVERRRVPLDHGIARAADIVRSCGDSAIDDLASELMSALEPPGGYQDDVAMLIYRQPPPLHMDLAAEVNHLAPTRAALRTWLHRAGVDPDQSLNVLMAAGEAVANAIEHGHRHTPGTVTLQATALADQVRVTVSDTGSWKTPQPVPDAHRGRGITLMRGLMEDVVIRPGAAGTTVELKARIR